MSNYPDRLFRGIRKADWVFDDGGERRVIAGAFEPDPKTATLEHRQADKCTEASIAWEDSDAVAEFVRKNNGQHGLAVLTLASLHTVENNSIVKGRLLHERRPETGFDAHGNLLFRADMPAQIRKMITTMLAMNAQVE